MTSKPLTVEELERFVREFIRENQAEPLKCIYCGEPATSGPMASGAIWFGLCGLSPTRSHSYEFMLNTDPDAEVKRLMKFAEFYFRQLWLEAAEIAEKWEEFDDASTSRLILCQQLTKMIADEFRAKAGSTL